jgi:hypothetical protein
VVPGSGDHPARRLIAAKYRGWRKGEPLSNWASRSPLIELDGISHAGPEGASGAAAGRL